MGDSEADTKRPGALDDEQSGANMDYRCRKCDSVVPRGTHHKMSSCHCGAVMVDRGWYGSRRLEGPHLRRRRRRDPAVNRRRMA